MKEHGGGITRVEPDWARTEFDNLPWAGNRRLGDIEPAEFLRSLLAWRIAGCSAEKGRSENARCFSLHLDRLRSEAAQAAVNAWLEEAASK